MTRPAPQILEALAADGRGLRITFVWSGDRFSHSIAAVDAARLFPLLASTDCCEPSAWPDSPPLQQLSIEARDDNSQVALLVGMAGQSHWSASVQTDPANAALLFDVAVRTSQPSAFAGSNYRAMLAPRSNSASQLLLENESQVVEVSIRDQDRLELKTTPAGFVVQSLEIPARFPATLRWQYRVSLLSD